MPSAFPNFEPLGLEHKPLVESYASKFPPYSDFNFTSLYCYNTTGSVGVCTLNDNLVVRFSDYLTCRPFYSFLGDVKTSETAHALLEHAKKEGGEAELKLVPESAVHGLDRAKFRVEEDGDNVDYVLSIDRLESYEGSKLKPHRNAVTRFLRSHRPETRRLDLTDPAIEEMLTTFFLHWVEQRKIPFSEAENEFKAMSNLFKLLPHEPIFGIGIFVDGTLAGFSISEILSEGYATIHYEKGDPSRYIGIYEYVTQETAKILSGMGCMHINYQQDMGLPGLKAYKKGYHPASYLRKFRVSWK